MQKIGFQDDMTLQRLLVNPVMDSTFKDAIVTHIRQKRPHLLASIPQGLLAPKDGATLSTGGLPSGGPGKTPASDTTAADEGTAVQESEDIFNR